MRPKISRAAWRMAGLAAIPCLMACSSAGAGGGAATDGGATGSGSGSSSGGSSASSRSSSAAVPSCDTATNNLTVQGFGAAPMTMTGGTPVKSISGANGTAIGLEFGAKIDSGGEVTTNVTSKSSAIAKGADLTIGSDVGMQIHGTGPTGQQFFCDAESGRVLVNDLETHSVDPNTPTKGEVEDKSNVGFAVSCKPGTAMPAGVTQVSGCYNLAM